MLKSTKGKQHRSHLKFKALKTSTILSGLLRQILPTNTNLDPGMLSF